MLYKIMESKRLDDIILVPADGSSYKQEFFGYKQIGRVELDDCKTPRDAQNKLALALL